MSDLKLTNLSKVYRIYASPKDRLVELLTGRSRHHVHCALRGIDLSISKGEAIGVIGNNGAGKSTLLKLVTGTLHPTTGSVDFRGRLTAILELGTGFHPDFSGYENLYYAGSLMGISAQEIDARFHDIAAFSELGEAIDQPIKTYSTGMVVRLAFSLMTMVSPDILIIDEALAVGDRNFQKKCIDRMMEIKHSGTTILFCSHSMHHITQFCDRAIWLDSGEVRYVGEANEVVDRYIADNSLTENEESDLKVSEPDGGADLHCRVNGMTVTPAGAVIRGEPINVSLEFTILKPDQYVLGMAVDRKDTGMRIVAETSLENSMQPIALEQGSYTVTMRLDSGMFRAGVYTLYAGLLHSSLLKIEDLRELDFTITDPDNIKSPAQVRGTIEWDVGRQLFR
ncbi:MAG: ABC transporter ATP-binding protein [Candidatus Thiodiazotropha sp.]